MDAPGAQKEVLSILLGDFNFVPLDSDRILKADGRWSGFSDALCAKAWQSSLAVPFSLMEARACETGASIAWLDRVYANLHQAALLELDSVAMVLPPPLGSRTTAQSPL